MVLRDTVSGHSGDVLVVGVDNLSGFLPSIMILWFKCVKHVQRESEKTFVLQSTQKIKAYNGMISIFFQVEGSLFVFHFFFFSWGLTLEKSWTRVPIIAVVQSQQCNSADLVLNSVALKMLLDIHVFCNLLQTSYTHAMY